MSTVQEPTEHNMEMREISSVRDYYIKAGWGLLLIITYIPRRCSVDGLEEGELEGQAGSGSRCPGWALVRSPGALLVAGSGVLGRIQGYRRASLVAMGMGWSVSSLIRAGQDNGMDWFMGRVFRSVRLGTVHDAQNRP